jgi:hypothetical protein
MDTFSTYINKWNKAHKNEGMIAVSHSIQVLNLKKQSSVSNIRRLFYIFDRIYILQTDFGVECN